MNVIVRLAFNQFDHSLAMLNVVNVLGNENRRTHAHQIHLNSNAII